MARLYEADRRISGSTGQSELARRLNTTPQRVKNWESRGLSLDGAVEVQSALGISATWVLYGTGPELIGATETGVPQSQLERPDPEILLATYDFLEKAFGSLGREFSLRADADLFADVYEWLAQDDRPVDERNLVHFAQWREGQQKAKTGGSNDEKEGGTAVGKAAGTHRRRSAR